MRHVKYKTVYVFPTNPNMSLAGYILVNQVSYKAETLITYCHLSVQFSREQSQYIYRLSTVVGDARGNVQERPLQVQGVTVRRGWQGKRVGFAPAPTRWAGGGD